MNLFGFVHLGMAVVSTQGSARSGLGYRNLGRRSPVSAIGLMRGGKACARSAHCSPPAPRSTRPPG